VRPGQCRDPALDRAGELLLAVGAGQAHRGLRDGQRVLGAVVDLPREDELALLGVLAGRDVGGDALQPVAGRRAVPPGGGAPVEPAQAAIARADDAELPLQLAAAAGLGERGLQGGPVLGMHQGEELRLGGLALAGGQAEQRRELGGPADQPGLPVVPEQAEPAGMEREAQPRLAPGQGGGAFGHAALEQAVLRLQRPAELRLTLRAAAAKHGERGEGGEQQGPWRRR
jgi:hypothetical protein